MSDQYLRKFSLILTDNLGVGQDFSDYRCVFKTRQMDLSTPNTLVVRIYNLDQATINLVEKEFSQVQIKAGYQNGNFGVIFEGGIKYFRKGRESETDTYLDVFAGDTDEPYNYSVLATSLPAGTNVTQALQHVASQMNKQYPRVSAGYIAPGNSQPLPRGRVMFGMSRDILSQLSATGNSAYQFVNGKLQVVPLNSYLPGETFIITSATGMIGNPEQTPDGVHVRTLINPNFYTNRLLQLDNASINTTVANGGGTQRNFFPRYDAWTGFDYLADTSADGTYRMIVVEHEGDTRGLPWYTNILCLAIGDAVPPTLVARGLGGEGTMR